MNKLFNKIIMGALAIFLFTGTVFAANSTSIRLQQPDSYTNKTQFNITFVALDTNATQPISVQCYKKGPTDGDFVAFGSTINLTNGGNTDNCQVDGVMNQGSGTYYFEVIATGSTTPTSNVVSVNFNNSEGPGEPTNYSKTKVDDCSYKISFRTANDSGKTVKVNLYRSSESTFNVDSGHQVNSINIGSDTDGSMTNGISPCDGATYYYVIRAFDVYGNGSGIVGDSSTSTTVINATTTTTTQAQGAIEIVGGGQVLGEKEVSSEAAKEVLGEDEEVETGVLQNSISNTTSWIMTHKKISLVILIIIIGTVFSLYRRLQKRVK